MGSYLRTFAPSHLRTNVSNQMCSAPPALALAPTVIQYGRTALIHAAQKGHSNIVQRLIKSGAKLSNSKALLRSAEAGHDAVFSVLREAGANLDSVSVSVSVCESVCVYESASVSSSVGGSYSNPRVT